MQKLVKKVLVIVTMVTVGCLWYTTPLTTHVVYRDIEVDDNQESSYDNQQSSYDNQKSSYDNQEEERAAAVDTAAVKEVAFSKLSKEERDSLFFRVQLPPKQSNSTGNGPIDYLPNYRNPCWESQSKSQHCGVSCLPMVFLVGVTKSGTTDLYDKLVNHKDIAAGRIKEPMWWNRQTIKQYPKMSTFANYINMFSHASCVIQAAADSDTGYHHKITMDGTPAYLWDYDGWEHIPGNKGLSEPKYILPTTLKVLIPQARTIAILRQPSERVYSQFRMKNGRLSVQTFHQRTVEAITALNKCLSLNTLRHCTYNRNVVKDYHGEGMIYRASMYYIYVKDWLESFPRDQILVIKGEDYYSNRTQTLMEAYNFLSLDLPSPQQFQSIESAKAKNTRAAHRTRSDEPMLPQTRKLLDDFYAPLNKKLADLLGDDRFLWSTDH